MEPNSTVNADDDRQKAIRRLNQKRHYRRQVVNYLAVNAGLIVIWLLGGGGYFWPIWPIFGWGLALLIQGWKLTHPQRPFSEEEIQREIERG
jgi:fatty acid desaturase